MENTNLAVLMRIFPGRASISLTEAADALGMGHSTVTNRISNDTFDIPTRKSGGRKLVPIAALAAYLDGETSAKPANAIHRLGRPRLVAREGREGGVE